MWPPLCAAEDCIRPVHLHCQRYWEQLNCFIGFKNEAVYCIEHHPTAAALLEIPLEEIEDIFHNSSSIGDVESIVNNTNHTPNKEDMESNSVNSNEDNYNDIAEVGDFESSDEEGEEIDKHNTYLEEVREEQFEHHNSDNIGDDGYTSELFTRASTAIANTDNGAQIEEKHWLAWYGHPINGAPWLEPGR